MSIVVINYDGKSTTVETGQTATLACFDKKMKSNVVITSLPETGVDTDTREITDTWEQIGIAISSGVYSTRYAVGDTKTMTLTDGTAVDMQIVAFDADVLSDGSGNAPISWVSRGVITYHVMYSEETDVGGWEASEMRSWLRGDFYATLPSEVTTHIVEVNKTYFDKTSNTTMSCTDTVWIPSVREVFGDSSSSSGWEDSGADYTAVFKDATSRIKHYSSGSPSIWWLRTTARLGSSSFRCVNGTGVLNTDDGTLSRGVVLGFCM